MKYTHIPPKRHKEHLIVHPTAHLRGALCLGSKASLSRCITIGVEMNFAFPRSEDHYNHWFNIKNSIEPMENNKSAMGYQDHQGVKFSFLCQARFSIRIGPIEEY